MEDASRFGLHQLWLVTVSSMEQVIGAAISTIAGIILPMLALITAGGRLSPLFQGLVAAAALTGIGVGSLVIGRLADRSGYLLWFRLCPVLIAMGGLLAWLLPGHATLVIGLFVGGVGIGGGYSLDSAYISELIAPRWRQRMIGVAKASSALGFIGAAGVCWLILRHRPVATLWNWLMALLVVAGVVTLAMRIRWWESPAWLLARGRKAEAQECASHFGIALPTDVAVADASGAPKSAPRFSLKQNRMKIVFSGIPWACEGLGVYGFGVFLPILLMAMGVGDSHATGMTKVVGSISTTVVVNCFILVGFVIGLIVVQKVNKVRLMSWGFILSAVGLAVIFVGYTLRLPDWTLVAGFTIFETALNAGPHLITYIIPAAIYPVDERTTGSGIAALLGKLGAIVGVVVMPILLHAGGIRLVMGVSAAVMIAGALVGEVYGRKLGLTRSGVSATATSR